MTKKARRKAILETLAQQPNGMLTREMQKAAPVELHKAISRTAPFGVRIGLIEYALYRYGQHHGQTYQITSTGLAALRSGEPDLAPVPKRARALRPRHRRYAILTILSGNSGGMSCTEIIKADGGTPTAGMQCKYGELLRTALDLGYVTRFSEHRIDDRGYRRITWIWQITQEGRAALAADSAPRPQPKSEPSTKGKYAWVADAARRHHNGETIDALAQSLGVHRRTVRHALEAAGHTIILVRPADAYNVSPGRIRTILQRDGVTMRNQKAAANMRFTLHGKPNREISCAENAGTIAPSEQSGKEANNARAASHAAEPSMTASMTVASYAESGSLETTARTVPISPVGTADTIATDAEKFPRDDLRPHDSRVNGLNEVK
jgi:hypothetical protein